MDPKPEVLLEEQKPTVTQMLDEYWSLRAKRLAMEKEAEAIKLEEGRLSHQIRLDITAPIGEVVKAQTCQAMLKPVRKAVVQDWEKFYAHVAATNGFDMLYKAITQSAVKERWENLEEVPGIIAEDTVELSIGKLK